MRSRRKSIRNRSAACLAAVGLLSAVTSGPVMAEDKLLTEVVDFTGIIMFRDSRAPTRNFGAFVAINKFDFAAAMNMAAVVNEMIATQAPR